VVSPVAYAGQPRITLLCHPNLKTRLLFHLANWATDETGQLDPGVEIRTDALRDRGWPQSPRGNTVFDIAFGLFAKYGDLPFTTDKGKIITWWQAPATHVIYPEDLQPFPGGTRA
jgi:hypothetical protein